MYRFISVIVVLMSCIGRVLSPVKRSGHVRIMLVISLLVVVDVVRVISMGRW